MNLATVRSWNFGSGDVSRSFTCPLRGMIALLGLLGPVLGAALAAFLHANRIQGTAHHVITDARQVLYPATAYQHHRMLLEVMAHSRNVGGDFVTIGQPHARDLAQ